MLIITCLNTVHGVLLLVTVKESCGFVVQSFCASFISTFIMTSLAWHNDLLLIKDIDQSGHVLFLIFRILNDRIEW